MELGKWGGEAEAGMDVPTQQLLQAMVRLSLRHEHELGMLRAETGFMLFLDTPSHHELSFLRGFRRSGPIGRRSVRRGPLKILLLMAIAKELKTRLEVFRDDTERLERAMTTGWISQGSTQMDPVWHYYVWNPKEKKRNAPSIRLRHQPFWPLWTSSSRTSRRRV